MELIPDTLNLDDYLREPSAGERVKPASFWKAAVRDSFFAPKETLGAKLPWVKTHHTIQLRKGELSLWAGMGHQGKSVLTNQVALSLCQQGERVCIASMEMKPEATMRRMTRQAAGTDEPSLRFVNKFHDWTDDKLWIFDHHGQVKADRITAVARYCVDKLGITHFFVDSLMKCIRGEDDYNGQKDFVDALFSAAHDTGMHIHVVHHIKKIEDENRIPTVFQIKGSGSITDQVDNIFIVFRNRKKERDREAGKEIEETHSDGLINCEKQRNGEWIGLVPLWFDKKAMTFRGDLRESLTRGMELDLSRQPGEDEEEAA